MSQYLKGDGKEVLTIKVPGGCANGYCMGASGAPVFEVGQKRYFYLRVPKDNEYDLG